MSKDHLLIWMALHSSSDLSIPKQNAHLLLPLLFLFFTHNLLIPHLLSKNSKDHYCPSTSAPHLNGFLKSVDSTTYICLNIFYFSPFQIIRIAHGFESVLYIAVQVKSETFKENKSDINISLTSHDASLGLSK